GVRLRAIGNGGQSGDGDDGLSVLTGHRPLPDSLRYGSGSSDGPSIRSMREIAAAWRSFFASAYSGDAHQRRAASAEGNSRITKRSGFQSPSRVSILPPRTA